MPNFAANLTMLFTEVPFLERFAAAEKAGFRSVEFLFPYPYSISELKSLIDKHNLEIVRSTCPPATGLPETAASALIPTGWRSSGPA